MQIEDRASGYVPERTDAATVSCSWILLMTQTRTATSSSALSFMTCSDRFGSRWLLSDAEFL